MRLMTALIFLALAGFPAWGAESVRRSTQDSIRIATQRAADELYAQVGKIPLTDRLTIGDYIKAVNAEDDLKKALERADQIGAPRWLDPNTCQIQLEISTARVATALRQMALAHPNSPLRLDEINLAMSRYQGKTVFSLGATSFAPSLGDYRPTNSNWSAVPDDARRAALLQAGANARQTVFANVLGVKLVGQLTLGEALRAEGIQEFLTDYFAQRPVTRVDFKDDLSVEVTLGVDAQGLFDVLRIVMERQGGAGIPHTKEDWTRVETEFVKKVGPALGKASAAQTKPQAGWTPPKKAPDWVDQDMDIRGVGKAPTKLKAALNAEQDARLKLRLSLDALEIEPNKTLGQLAQAQPLIGLKLARMAEEAKIVKTDYLPDGSASLSLQFDLGILWDELRK
jgi:hypothetical protein